MIGPISSFAVVVIIGLIVWRVITGSVTGRRAALQVKSLTGENLAVFLAIATITEVMLTIPRVPAMAGIPESEVAGTVVATALVGIVGLAIVPRITVAVLSVVALAGFVADLYVSQGPGAAAMVLIAAALMLMLLSIVRGFSPVS